MKHYFFIHEYANYCGIGDDYMLIAENEDDAIGYADEVAANETAEWEGDPRFDEDEPVEVEYNIEEIDEEEYKTKLEDGYEVMDDLTK